MHVYLALPGDNLLHPFPIFSYRSFSQDTIYKIAKTSITYNKAENTRYVCNSTPQANLEQEVLEQPPPPHKTSKPTTHTPTAVCPKEKHNSDKIISPTLNDPSIPSNVPHESYSTAAQGGLRSLVSLSETCVIHYGFTRDRHIHLHISHKILDIIPTDTQDCINLLCYEMIEKPCPGSSCLLSMGYPTPGTRCGHPAMTTCMAPLIYPCNHWESGPKIPLGVSWVSLGLVA